MKNNFLEKKEAFLTIASDCGYTNKELASIFCVSSQRIHKIISSAKNKRRYFSSSLISKNTKQLQKYYPNVEPIILQLEIIFAREKYEISEADAIKFIKEKGINFKESTNRIIYKNKRYKNLNVFLSSVFPECPSVNVFCYEIDKYIKKEKCSRNQAINYVMENKNSIFIRGFNFNGKIYKNKKDAILHLFPTRKYENVCALISQYQRIYKVSRYDALVMALNKYNEKQTG